MIDKRADLSEFSLIFVGKMCVFVSRPMTIVNFSQKTRDHAKRVVDFPLERDTLIILIFGLMEAERISPLRVGFEVAGSGVYLPASEVAFESLVWGTAEEYGDALLECCRAFLPLPGVLQTVQRAELWVLLLPCRRTGLVIWVLITSMLLGLLGDYWIGTAWQNPCLWFRMLLWSLLSST